MCPFAHKAWIALEVAQIPYEMEEIGLYGPGGKPDWFWKLNPQGTVPVFVDLTANTVLTDSDAILDYVQTMMDGDATGSSSGSIETIQKVRSVINQRLLPHGKQAVLQGHKGKLQETLVHLENDFCMTSVFLAGDAVSIADCHAFPFLWRLRKDDLLDATQHPSICQWLDRCEALPAFQTTLPRSWWWWW